MDENAKKAWDTYGAELLVLLRLQVLEADAYYDSLSEDERLIASQKMKKPTDSFLQGDYDGT